MLWQRYLNDETVDVVIVVQFINLAHQFIFRDGVGQTNQGRLKTDLLAVQYLVVHIGFTGPVIANQNSGQVGGTLAGCLDIGNLFGDCMPDPLSRCI